jgi:hypothetical protein
MPRLVSLAVLCWAALSSGCGGDSSSGGGSAPTAPSPTATSIQVSLPDVILVGTSETATATASWSNGSTQAVTSGFQSDVPSVATAESGGRVTGVANGRANIYVVHLGAQGTKNIRVVPNYIGDWVGSYIVRTSTCTGDFLRAGICDSTFAPNRVFPTDLDLSQTRDVVTGRTFLGTIPSDTFTANVRDNGSIACSVVGRSGDGQFLQGWSINSTRQGSITGSFNLLFTLVGASGELRATMGHPRPEQGGVGCCRV